MSMKTLTLKRGEDRRLRRGHQWVFSNEISDNLSTFEIGEAVTVLDSQNRPVGSGTVNPHSLIAVRLHSNRSNQPLDKLYLKRRIRTAIKLRTMLGYGDVARLVHGEGDRLPGLIVDQYGDVLVIQLNSAGMDARSEEVRHVLWSLLKPSCIIEANESNFRQLEGLEQKRVIHGDLGDDIYWYKQNGLDWPLDFREGQKTGSYLDQVESRLAMASLSEGCEVLDAYSYTGGFGMLAAAAGAKEVVLADRSARALEVATEAFERNKLPKPETIEIELLDSSVDAKTFGRQFDRVIADPPPLVKSKAKKAEGLKKTGNVFAQACSWTKPQGLAALFSCSHNASLQDVDDAVARAEYRIHKKLRRLARFDAGADHPVSVGHSETDYLHGVLVEVG